MSTDWWNWPENNDREEYMLSGGYTLGDIIEKCRAKWPDTSFEDIEIESEHIQFRCLGYDRYDPSDYGDFIVARLKSS